MRKRLSRHVPLTDEQLRAVEREHSAIDEILQSREKRLELIASLDNKIAGSIPTRQLPAYLIARTFEDDLAKKQG
jgi:3-deoxy-D-arabino-heptulosonate 7-phosphate (DAHP) synthase